MKFPTNTKPKQSPEVLVVGAGLSGLLFAAHQIRLGKSVHLTEKLPRPGGRASPEDRSGFFLGSGFAFADSSWWRSCADRLGLSSPTVPVHSGGALVFGSRGWVTPEEIPVWESYLSRPCSEFPEKGFFGIFQTLLDYCASSSLFSCSFESPVTALNVVDGKVQSVALATDSVLEAQQVYWCADYKDLLENIKGPQVPEMGPERVSWLKKFVKAPKQPGVVLEFAHKGKPSDFSETLLLPFSAGEKEERRYLVGSFASNRDPGLAPSGSALSSWVLPLTEAEWGDNHESMKKIRSARRLLDKALPGFDQSILFDRVIVLESTVWPLERKKGDWQPLLPNLLIGADWGMPSGSTPEALAEVLSR